MEQKERVGNSRHKTCYKGPPSTTIVPSAAQTSPSHSFLAPLLQLGTLRLLQLLRFSAHEDCEGDVAAVCAGATHLRGESVAR